MLKPIIKTFTALNSNVRKEQLSSGFAWGLLLAFVPAGNLLWVVLLIISFIPKNNYAAQLLSLALFKLLFPLLALLSDAVGWYILTQPALFDFFTYAYNAPLVRFTRFNNTLVTGGLVLGIILWLPVFFLIRVLVPVYRNTIAPKIKNSKLYKSLIKIPLVSKLVKVVQTASGTAQMFE